MSERSLKRLVYEAIRVKNRSCYDRVELVHAIMVALPYKYHHYGSVENAIGRVRYELRQSKSGCWYFRPKEEGILAEDSDYDPTVGLEI